MIVHILTGFDLQAAASGQPLMLSCPARCRRYMAAEPLQTNVGVPAASPPPAPEIDMVPELSNLIDDALANVANVA